MSPNCVSFWTVTPICSTTFASTPGWDCYATSGWPTEPANYPAACCPTRPTAGSCSATASGSQKTWRASSRASQRSMRCTSTRSVPNRRHATSQPLSEPRAARRRTATEHRALAEARHGSTAAACECPGDPAPGLARRAVRTRALAFAWERAAGSTRAAPFALKQQRGLCRLRPLAALRADAPSSAWPCPDEHLWLLFARHHRDGFALQVNVRLAADVDCDAVD